MEESTGGLKYEVGLQYLHPILGIHSSSAMITLLIKTFPSLLLLLFIPSFLLHLWSFLPQLHLLA